MRYSKVLLIMLLTLVLILGTMGSAFATQDWNFRTHTLTVRVDAGSAGMGTVSGSGEYRENKMVDVSATPAENYRFVKWTYKFDRQSEKDYTNKPASFEYKMPDAAVILTAYFELIPSFEITTFVEDEDDWGTVTGGGIYQVGDPVTLEAIAARGYLFSHWEWTWCPQIISFEPTDASLSKCKPDFDSEDPTITFPMKECDGKFTAYFDEIDMSNVMLIPVPSDKGNPTLDEFALPGDPGYDGAYYIGEKFQVSPNPVSRWHFVGYNYEYMCPIEDAKISLPAKSEMMPSVVSPYDTMDPNDMFTADECNIFITVYYVEDPFVMATIKYLDANDVAIKPETTEKVYAGPYSFAPPAIPGYTFGVSTPNASGTIGEGSTDFTVIHKYYVPVVITNTNTVTDTVFVDRTVFVNVPAPTEVITTEAIPLGAPELVNFDQIVEDITLEATEEVIIPAEEIPLADALPQTGQLPVDLFYGLGGLITAAGVFLKRRK